MKKILIIIVSIILIILVGVFAYNIIGKNESKENAGTTDNSQIGETNGQSENESAENENKEEPVEQEMVSLRIYGDIYVSYPSNWRAEDDTRSVVFYQDDASLVNIAYKKASSFDGELEDIPAFLSETFADGSTGYCQGSIYGSEIETTSMERGTVAGYDCVKFKGTIKTGDWDCHVYGYGLIVEDRVMMITGLVSDEEQDADMITKINALTDQIASSVRTKK